MARKRGRKVVSPQVNPESCLNIAAFEKGVARNISVVDSKPSLSNIKSRADDHCDDYSKNDLEESVAGKNYENTAHKNTLKEEKHNYLEDDGVNVMKKDPCNVDKGGDKNISKTQDCSGNLYKKDKGNRIEKLNNKIIQSNLEDMEIEMISENNIHAISKTQRTEIGNLAKNIQVEKNGQRIALKAVSLSVANAILNEKESTLADDAGVFIGVKRKDKKNRSEVEDLWNGENKQKLAESFDQRLVIAIPETELLEHIAETKVKGATRGESKAEKEESGSLEIEENGKIIGNNKKEFKFDTKEENGKHGESFTETTMENVEKLKNKVNICSGSENLQTQAPFKQAVENFPSIVKIEHINLKDRYCYSKEVEPKSSLECAAELYDNRSECEKDARKFLANKVPKDSDVTNSFVADNENCMEIRVKPPSLSANGADSHKLSGEVKLITLCETVGQRSEDKLEKKEKKSDETWESIVSACSATAQSYFKDSVIIEPQKNDPELNPLEKFLFKNIYANITAHNETEQSKAQFSKDKRNKLNSEGNNFGENKKQLDKMEVKSEKYPIISESLVRQQSQNGPEALSMVEESEDIFEVRPVFMSNVCHVCKETHRGETILKSCAACRMIAYCSSEHQKQHWPEHKDVCKFVKKDLKKRKHSHFFQSAKNSDYETWKRIRYTTMIECEHFIKRALQPYEREMFLFPRHCESCYETDGEKLHQCKKCFSSFFCSSGHKKKDHDRWCSDLKLLFDINIKQAKIGPIDPPLPDRVFQNYEILPDNIKKFLVTKMLGPKRSATYDTVTFSCLTEFASYPLTVIYAIQALEKVTSEGKGAFKPKTINSLDSIVIHVVGAELIFECSSIIKWDIFFAHLLPSLKYLRIVFIGPELVSNPCIIPTGVCNEDLRCPRCSSSGRRIEYDFQPHILYQDYVKTKHYIKPTFIVAFNCGLYRDTGHSEKDTWGPCIENLTKDPFTPLILTAYTSDEAPKDVERVINTVKAEVLVKPQRNPYRSYKPCRNFINEDSIPVMFKNNYFSVLRGTETP